MQELTRMALAVLTEHESLTVREVAALLAAQGVELGEAQVELVERALLDEPRVFRLPDERFVDLKQLVDGLTVTHRLSEDESRTEAVAVDPDLAPLLLNDRYEFPLPAGGEARIRFSGRLGLLEGNTALTGPPGWLGDVAGGDLLAFHLAGGHLHVERMQGELADLGEAAKRLAAAFAASVENGRPVTGYHLVAVALGDAPELLRRPLAPLSEVLEAAELEVSGAWVGTKGQDWSRRHPIEAVYQQMLGVDDLQAQLGRSLLNLFARFLTTEQEKRAALRHVLTPVGPMLSLDRIADTFLAATLDWNPELERDIAEFAQAVVEIGLDVAGAHYVLSRCAEYRRDVTVAEAHLAAALAGSPALVPALFDAAWYAEDRGNAAWAVSSLRRAGVRPDDLQITRLEPFAAPGPAAVGRNQPCPCGSSRTYKVCCAPRNGHALADRADWLHYKAQTFLLRPPQRDALRQVALARIGKSLDDAGVAWVAIAFHDPLTQDVGLFDTGVFASFLDVRGPLLPADELALGRSWVGIRRSLYEIIDVRSDERLQLRDLRTGTVLDVAHGIARSHRRAGVLLCGRVLPDGRGHRLLDGTMWIQPTARDDLLALLDTDPSATKTAAWFSAAQSDLAAIPSALQPGGSL